MYRYVFVQNLQRRLRELYLLDALWAAPDATLLILYQPSPRRQDRPDHPMGAAKTAAGALLGGWNHPPVWTSLRSFSQTIYNFANPQAPAPADFTYTTWQQAWQQVANLAQTERLALFVDEFTYVLKLTPRPPACCKTCGTMFSSRATYSRPLCDSHLGMMQRLCCPIKRRYTRLRATRQLHLQPIPFGYPGFLPRLPGR
ncbi:MAG: hypothetical protein IPH82_02735 [Chloroflexi bacterium]|nr:hypothetical protein [Chloroflexota bacterium]